MPSWKEAGADIALRTVKTLCQTGLGLLSGVTVISDVDPAFVVSTLIVAGLSAVLMNTVSWLDKFEKARSGDGDNH